MRQLSVSAENKVSKAALIQAVIADKLSGKSTSAIAKDYGLSIPTVYRYWRGYRTDTGHGVIVSQGPKNDPDLMGQSSPTMNIAKDYKLTLKTKAINAVEAGLDSTEDSYKRGTLGARVLEGLGEFTVDRGPVNQVVFAISCPPELKGYFSSIPIDQAMIEGETEPTLGDKDIPPKGDSE